MAEQMKKAEDALENPLIRAFFDQEAIQEKLENDPAKERAEIGKSNTYCDDLKAAILEELANTVIL